MEIVLAKAEDFSQIVSLIKSEFSYLGVSLEQATVRMHHPDVFVFVAKRGKIVFGFIDLGISNNRGFLNGFSVRKDFRKKGIGKKLLLFGVKFLFESGVEKISLLVKQENPVAKKMYESAGFEFVRVYPKKIDGKTVEEMELRQHGVVGVFLKKFVS